MPKILVAKDGRTFRTERGKPFVPLGVNYYRPGTGWAPQVWKQFDAEATRQDFARMKALGVNCVRVFLSYGSFCTEPGVLKQEGLAKFDEFLSIAEQSGIYLHPAGLDHWEGPPGWKPAGIEADQTVQALEAFWRQFAARYRGRNVIFAYDLKNEPEVGWDNDTMRAKWNAWLKQKYGSAEKVVSAWGSTNRIEFGSIPTPPKKSDLNSRELLDFQALREELADEWTRRQVVAIKSADPGALVTVGLIQWSVPALLPAGPFHYSGFRPERQAKYLNFLEVHFYPLERGVFGYRNAEEELANLAYLESVVREVARPGKPVVLAEFGWYGGGKPRMDGGKHPEATEQQHARYCRRAVETSAGFVTGWLNWGFYDHPQATDCSELTGLLRVDGTPKAWGRTFSELAQKYSGRRLPAKEIGPRPILDWDACLTSIEAGNAFRKEYIREFSSDWRD